MKLLRAVLAAALCLFAVPALAAPVTTVGSLIQMPALSPATTAATYSPGFAVGGLMTLPSATNSAGGSALLQSVLMSTKTLQSTQVDVYIFNANPSASTCTDDAAFILANADKTKVVAVAHITDWTAGNTVSIGQSQGLAAPLALSTGTAAYACAVVRASTTYGSTSDASFLFSVLQNQ